MLLGSFVRIETGVNSEDASPMRFPPATEPNPKEEDGPSRDENFDLGRDLCFIKDDWRGGMVLLSKARNAGIRSAALQELADPSTLSAQIDVGSAWNAAAETTTGDDKWHCFRRARFWFAKAVAHPDAKDDPGVRAAVERRLEAVPKLQVELRIQANTYYTETIVVARNRIEWKSHDGAGPNSISNATTGVSLPSFQSIYPGYDYHAFSTDDTRSILPEAVDFTTAKLRINRKAGSTSFAVKAIIDQANSDESKVTIRLMEWNYQADEQSSYQGNYELDLALSFGR
jgi:hypothetical protein